jgi:diguanylate cyclase
MLRSRPPSTLRARLLLLAGVAVLPVTAGILYAGFEQRRQALAEVERQALALARSTVSEKERLVIETRQLLDLLAHFPQVRSSDPVACSAFLAEVMTSGGRYANLGVAQADGVIRCSALPIVTPIDASHRSWFLRAVERGGFAVGDYQIGSITGIATVNFGHPIEEGVAGVIFAALPLTWLQERLNEADLPPGSEVLVMDGSGTVLALFPEAEGWIGRSLAGTPLASVILDEDGGPVARIEGLDGVRRLYATTPLQDLPDEYPVVVSVGIPTAVAHAPVTLAVARNLALLALALVLVVAGVWWTSGVLVLKPVRSLLLATQRLRGKDLGARVDVRGAPREIAELSTSFNLMAAALQDHVHEIGEHLVQIRRLNRIRAVLGGISGAMLRTRERDELLRAACRISVDEGEFPLAWVAERDPTTGAIRVAAHAARGRAEGEGSVPGVLQGDGGIVAAALHGGADVVANDLEADPEFAGLGEELHALGIRSGAAVPLRVGDRVVASLNLYAGEAGYFTAEELRLLRELAADTSLGLEYLDKEKQLQYLVNYDPLTDLPNRVLFTDRLRQAIGRARKDGRLTAVLLIGIPRLSEINATLGHQAGDLVVRAVGSWLRDAVGEGDTASRLGSADFGVVIGQAESIPEIERTAARLFETAPRELVHGEDRIFLSLRIGIAVFPVDGNEPDGLIKAATLALETAGAPGTHPVAFYSAALDADAQRRRLIVQELRAAVEQGELTVRYQPVIALASGDPVGMEALVRWNNAQLGEVPPDTFIPLAEEMGIIGELGEWVLATAARQGRRLHEDGYRELRMNVNVSVSQLRDPAFLRNFARIVEETGIDLSRLGIGIEITESELMENIQESLAALEQFRKMGLWIYIDDFGTGYSSLSYLRVLPLDSLKIDRAFIRDIPRDPDAVAVVKAILALARSLDLRVIAEGVETEEQLAALRDFGCDSGQGYHFSPPLSAEELEAFLGARVQASGGTRSPGPAHR